MTATDDQKTGWVEFTTANDMIIPGDNQPRCTGILQQMCTRGICCLLFNVCSPLTPVTNEQSVTSWHTPTPSNLTPTREHITTPLGHAMTYGINATSTPSPNHGCSHCRGSCCTARSPPLSPIPSYVTAQMSSPTLMGISRSSPNSSMCLEPVSPPRHDLESCPLRHSLECSICNILLERMTYNMP